MDSVINELKQKRRFAIHEQETFRNKIKYYSVMDELTNNISKGRIKPSNIKNRQYYGSRFYSFLRLFGF